MSVTGSTRRHNPTIAFLACSHAAVASSCTTVAAAVDVNTANSGSTSPPHLPT
jgi:hypothetical protein